ncbi:hypothetical protein SF83666_a44070 (plasmid) [Sinorhizobium fredii CCBAU 83666]|nr:hypothetical protein SF83666_a44070 [Sinorhizobium fredii CCBAU 83666]
MIVLGETLPLVVAGFVLMGVGYAAVYSRGGLPYHWLSVGQQPIL